MWFVATVTVQIIYRFTNLQVCDGFVFHTEHNIK